MTTQIIDIFQSLNLVSDYNGNGLVTDNGITIDSYGVLTIYNTSVSNNSTTGALIIPYGGVSIDSNFNSTNVSNGGSLTVKGGASISQDVYIGGGLTITGSISGTNGTFTATDESINGSTGSLITIGGITVQANANATSSTAGGGVSVIGGVGIKQDLYVGGVSNLPDIISTNISSTNISSTNVNLTNISSSVLNVTGITAQNINFTGSLYKNGGLYISSQWETFSNNIAYTTGNVGLNTTSPSYLLDVNGSLRVSGTSGVLNIIESNITNDILQLRNVNASGGTTIQFLNNSSVEKMYFGYGNANSSNYQNTSYLETVTGVPIKLVAGGNSGSPIIINAADNSINIMCSTISTTTSSGSVKVSGGVGIAGNLYVGGELNIESSTAVNVTNTNVSLNSTTGAMLLIGGLSISILDTTNSNATSYTGGGGITIRGGLAASQDVYIGGIIDIKSGSNNLNSLNFQSIQMYSNSNAGAYSVIGSGDSTRTALSFTPLRFTGWNDQSNPKMTINTTTIDFTNSINAIHNSNTLGNIFTTGGNVGIGISTPESTLSIPNIVTNTFGNIYLGNNVQNRKMVIYSNNINEHEYFGLGINTNIFRYQTATTTDDHVFYAGTSSTTSDELFRIKGTGDIIVPGTTNSVSISSGNVFTTNITVGTLNSSVGITASNINFTGDLYKNGVLYVSNSQWSGTSTIYFGTTGSGALVGIGTSNPGYTLDVVGTSRITTSLTTGALYSTDSTITNGVFTNLSSGVLNASDLTSGNINFTGSLYQNGVLYTSNSSQWTGTTGSSIFYGSTGSVFVGIGTSNPGYTLDVAGPIQASSLILTGTTGSLNSTTASFVFHDISISNTTDVSSFTEGGAMTIAGGLAIEKSMAIGGGMNLSGITNEIAGTFNASNNVAVPTNITGLLFPSANIRSFTITASVQQIATANLYTQYTIEGIQSASNWSITEVYIGDDINIFFSIDSSGQLLYTTSNIAGFISLTINYRSISFSISGNYIQPPPPTSGNFIITGDLIVQSTTDAINISTGSIITNGGLYVSKSLQVEDNIILNNVSTTGSGTFDAVNGQGSPANITDLLIDSNIYTSFSILMTVILLRSAGGNFMSQYTIEGIQTDAGWAIYTTDLGDIIDLTFSIVSGTGQLQYSSGTTYTNFTSLTFNYQVTALYTGGTLNSLILPSHVTEFLFTGTTESTNTSTGTLIVNGGVAIQKNLNVGGSLSKGSGTFDIEHPLDNTKGLIHSFVEGPRCDLIYRGTIQLVNGQAFVNIDTDCVAEDNCKMSQGTFEALTINPVKYLHNNTSFDRIRGSISQNILNIICENTTSIDFIDWMVIAERKDNFIRNWERTNENGYLKTEYLK